MAPHGDRVTATAGDRSRYFASAAADGDGGGGDSSLDVDASSESSPKSQRRCDGANNVEGGVGDGSLLWSWATHTDSSYHDFSAAAAEAIRSALLTWYRANRRKLPWRGDPPPYDGSTAGTATAAASSSGRNKKKKMGDGSGDRKKRKQRTMGEFFAASKPKQRAVRPKRKRKDNVGAEEGAGTEGSGAVEKIEEVTAAAEAPEVTAYGVWVSEIMLQQTRVEAVIPYYLKWMKRFPTVQALAEADEEDVNAHWAGLGFYRRARMLHSGAKLVCDKFSGVVPSSVDDLLTIHGVGRYTASAIASIAHGACVPVVDGNVCRVLSRLAGIANHIKAPAVKDDLGWRLAGQIVAAGDGKNAGEVNQALMELGATYCAPTGTGTDERDPLREFYLSTKLGRCARDELGRGGSGGGGGAASVEEFVSNAAAVRGGRRQRCSLCDEGGISTVLYEIDSTLADSPSGEGADDDDAAAAAGHAALPTAPPKKAKREEVLAVAALCRRRHRTPGAEKGQDDAMEWLMVKRPKDGLLAGQWEFPTVCVWSSTDEKGSKKRCRGKNNRDGKKKKGGKGELEVPSMSVQKRQAALDSFLGEMRSSDGKATDLVCIRTDLEGSPLEHVFSHVRHTMWVEYGDIAADTCIDAVIRTADGREVQWMTEADMKLVGITSGVKKVLNAVKAGRR